MPLTEFPRPVPTWLAPRGTAGVAVLVASLLLAISSGVVLAVSAAEELPEDAVFAYEDDVVTQTELSDRMTSLEALYGVQPPAEGERLDEFKRAAAKSMALGLVIEDEAAERGIVISDKQARAELSKLISDRVGGDRQAFTRFLSESGITEAAVLDEIERTLATNRLFEAVTQDLEPATETEAREEYDARRDDMTTPEKRVLRNIVVRSEADAKAVLAELARRPFAQVARARSLDRATSGKGGALGALEQVSLEGAYAEAAFAAKPGRVFGPVRSQHGWNIGKVERVIPGDPLSFEQVRATLMQALTTREQMRVWREWIEGSLERADIEYTDEYRPDDPTGAPSDVAPQTSQEE